MNFRDQINLTQTLFLAACLICSFQVVAGGKPVNVNAASPNSALRGESLNVVIDGSGFVSDSTVEFLITTTEDSSQISVDQGSVATNAKGTQLSVDIVVNDDAEVVQYDIAVNSNGRRGKGTTLFSVKHAPDPVVTLEITYEFGTPDAFGDCTSPECVSSVITATSSVQCGQNYCDFNTRAEDTIFTLPSGLRDLLIATEWRRTPLNPDACFGSSNIDPVGTAVLGADENGTYRNIVFIRRDNDGASPWYASVGSFAKDVDGIEDRQYIFNFEGCAGDGNCGTFAAGSMEGEYTGGELIRIDSHGNDRKFLSVPCRCTMSNTPDCPDDVPSPTPLIRISVEDKTLP